MTAGEIAGDSGPVEHLIDQRSVRSTGESGGQQAGGDIGFALFHAEVCFAEIEHIQQVFRRQGVDRGVVDHLALIEDVDCRQPDQVQCADVRIPVVEPEWHEPGAEGGDDGWMWIRHGIQYIAAYSVNFFDIDQDRPILCLRVCDGLVPIVQPGDHWSLTA